MAAPEAAKVSLLVPDVPLRSLDALSSGPTSPDHSTVADVRELLARYRLAPKLPPSVRAFFEREDLPESPGNKVWRPPFFPRMPWTGAVPRGARQRPPPCRERMKPSAIRSSRFCSQATTWWKMPRPCPKGRLPRRGRQQLRRLGLRGCRPLPAPALPLPPRLPSPPVPDFRRRGHGEARPHPGAGGRNQQFAMDCALELEQHPASA